MGSEPCVYSEASKDIRAGYTCSTIADPFAPFVTVGHPALDAMFAKLCPDSCGFSSKEEFYKSLGKISKIGFSYSGELAECVYSSETCSTFQDWRNSYRQVDIHFGDLISNIRKEVLALGYSGCDYMNVYVGQPEITPTKAIIRGGWDGKSRFYCDDILGTATKFSFSGNFVIEVSVTVTPPLGPFSVGVENPFTEGVLAFNLNHYTYNEKTKFLTIFNTKTLVGNIVRRILTLPFDLATRLFSDDATTSDKLRLLENLTREIDTAGLATLLAEEAKEFELFPAKTKGLVKLDKYFPYRVDRDRTGLLRLDNGSPILRLSYVKTFPTRYGDVDIVGLHHDGQRNLLKIINSLGLQAQSYVIGAGDTLENLSAEAYESFDLAFYLAVVNDIDNPNSILIGQTISIPPFWRVSLDIQEQRLIVSGDSFYTRLIDMGLDDSAVMTMIKDLDLSDFVFPFSAVVPEK